MLTKEIANEIVKETTKRLNRNVNIMDASGTIIASSDKSRINTIHEGALQVIRTGEPFIIADGDTNLLGVKPGVNLPITFNEKIVGVIGITGNPKELHEFGFLVKMITEMMINHSFLSSQIEWKYRTQEMIMDELLKRDFRDEYVKNRLKLLDKELNPPFYVAIIFIKERNIQDQKIYEQINKIFYEKTILVGYTKVNRLTLFLSHITNEVIVEKLTQLLKSLDHLGVECKIGYSRRVVKINDISRAYQEAELALLLSSTKGKLTSIENIEAQALIYQLEEDLKERYLKRFLGSLSKKYIDTLDIFFQSNQNVTEAANKLFLHRNTLIYRLSQIREKTGYDPKVFSDAVELQLFVWLYNNRGEK